MLSFLLKKAKVEKRLVKINKKKIPMFPHQKQNKNSLNLDHEKKWFWTLMQETVALEISKIFKKFIR